MNWRGNRSSICGDSRACCATTFAAAAFPTNADRCHDPTLAWDHAAIPVDDQLVEFATLSEHEYWVAQAIIDPLVVGIESRHWPVESVGLRAETRFDAYAEGAARVRRPRHR